jgi:hypothetical protein
MSPTQSDFSSIIIIIIIIIILIIIFINPNFNPLSLPCRSPRCPLGHLPINIRKRERESEWKKSGMATPARLLRVEAVPSPRPDPTPASRSAPSRSTARSNSSSSLQIGSLQIHGHRRLDPSSRRRGLSALVFLSLSPLLSLTLF